MSEYFKENVKFVIVRRFIQLAEAKIYELSLLNAGIRCFLSNTNASQLLHFSDGGITLHVSEDQIEEAKEIIHALDSEASKPIDDDYREADHDDIEFAKQMNERAKSMDSGSGKILLIFLILFVILIFIFAIFGGFEYF